jgi:hypothetical protein
MGSSWDGWRRRRRSRPRWMKEDGWRRMDGAAGRPASCSCCSRLEGRKEGRMEKIDAAAAVDRSIDLSFSTRPPIEWKWNVANGKGKGMVSTINVLVKVDVKRNKS